MSDSVTCDSCGRTEFREGLFGWLAVSREGMDARTYGQPLGPWHFDSLECLVAWAQKRAEGRP